MPDEGAIMLRLPPTGKVIPTTRVFLVTLPLTAKEINAVPIRSATTVVHSAEIGRASRMLPRSPLFFPENISALNNDVANLMESDSIFKDFSVIIQVSDSALLTE
jgi:hypothetical protein